jgi:hypothetical protein
VDVPEVDVRHLVKNCEQNFGETSPDSQMSRRSAQALARASSISLSASWRTLAARARHLPNALRSPSQSRRRGMREPALL